MPAVPQPFEAELAVDVRGRDRPGQVVQFRRNETGAEDHAEPRVVDRRQDGLVGLRVAQRQAGVEDRQVGGRHRQLDVDGHDLGHLLDVAALFLADALGRVELADLAGHAAGIGGGVEPGDRADGRAAGADRLGQRRGPQARRTDHPHSRNHHAATHQQRPLSGSVVVGRLQLPELPHVQHADEVLGEDEVLVARPRSGARDWSRCANIIWISATRSPFARDAALDGRALGPDLAVHDGLQPDLVARHDAAVERGLRDLRQDHLLLEVERLAHQDAARLRHPLDHQRRRMDRITRNVVVQVLFGQGDVLDGHRAAARLELNELVDPDPAHWASGVTRRKQGRLHRDRAAGAFFIPLPLGERAG